MVWIYVTLEKCSRNSMVCRVTEVTAKRVGLQVTGISCYQENMLIQKELPLTLILLTWRIW